MKINIEEVKKTLALSVLPQIDEICVFDVRTIDLDGSDLLNLPKQSKVSLFFFECEKKLFAGILTDFILENTGKPNDPFVLENEFANVVNQIGVKVGLSNAKVYNPIRNSSAEVEGLPFGTGDCFIFSL